MIKPTIVRLLLTSLLFATSHLSAQSGEPVAVSIDERPLFTDKACAQLIENYLAVTGGKQAHARLENVRATGTLTEAGKTKKFEIFETRDGKRKITYNWRFLGREYLDVQVFDGETVWTQTILPQEKPPRHVKGQAAKHFMNQRWFFQPMIDPMRADFDFRYQGTSHVSGRAAHLVVGYGIDDERTWFYFDKETFLITRWGGLGTIAGVSEYMDYCATSFSKMNGVLLPKEIKLIAESQPFGLITIDKIETNLRINSIIFQLNAFKNAFYDSAIRRSYLNFCDD